MTVPGTNTAKLMVIYQGGSVGPPLINTYPSELGSAPLATLADALGYSNRDCGSYAAWMVASTGGNMPPKSQLSYGGLWAQNVDPSWLVTTPIAGDIACRKPASSGDLGHVMYIVNPNYMNTGNLLVQAYNSNQQGNFSIEVWSPTGLFNGAAFQLIYIRFPAAA